MSERPVWAALGSIILLLTMSISAILGNRQGRAEMKHWQDEWYASHPVVKETPPEAPRIKAKPLPIAHEGCKPTDIKGPVYIQYYDDGSFQFVLTPSLPKPRKGSKRKPPREPMASWDGWADLPAGVPAEPKP